MITVFINSKAANLGLEKVNITDRDAGSSRWIITENKCKKLYKLKYLQKLIFHGLTPLLG